MPEKMRKRACAAVSALLAIAMTCAFTSVSIAEEPTTPTTGDSAATTTQTRQQTDAQTDTQQSETTENQSDADNGNAATENATDQSADSNTESTTQPDSSATTPSDDSGNTAKDTGNSAAPAATGDCTAVADWDTLKQCVEAGGTVTIVKSIDVTNGDSVTVSQDVTLISRIPLNDDDKTYPSTFKFENGDTKGSLFVINSGTLTIGADANDQAFTYFHVTRRFATVNAKAALVIDGGTFSYITVGDLADVVEGKVQDKNAKWATAGVAINRGGSITVNNGVFDNVTTQNGFFTGIFQQKAGSITINDGTFSNNTGVRGSVISNAVAGGEEKSSITINGGTFDNNKTTYAGGVIMQNDGSGTTTIAGGTFSNNTSGSKGGVIHNNGTLTIAAGTFTGNKALGSGGGAISQDSGSTIITKGTFSGNKQTFELDGRSVECTNDKPSACRAGNSGGGAIRVDAGTLTIQGPVQFDKNYSRAYGWNTGGGAIYVKGTLWLKNNTEGYGPQFTNNWAGIYDTQYVTKDGKEVVPNGGAGGAIFLQEGGSTAYLMGGTFTGNSSGYLGGAVYTEIDSTTYIAKAVAYSNFAGHFGGGLWLCPSGTGEASKGGNIALFNNEVHNYLDPNPDNDGSQAKDYGGDGVEAGADFAIMNPYHKDHQDTSFVLMDTWFTNRTESAVTWYHDGSPLLNASGYDDSYQNPDHKYNSHYPGKSVAITKKDGRYEDGSTSAIKDSEYTDHVNTLKLSGHGTANTYNDSGVALKAVVKGDTEAEQNATMEAAKKSAAVTFAGNKARLSGGAFGTNGNVKFSTPWTASWFKVANGANGQPDENQPLAGSHWLIESTAEATSTDNTETAKYEAETKAKTDAGGPFEEDFYPTICAAKKITNADNTTSTEHEGFAEGKCWKEVVGSTDNGNGTTTYTVTRSAIVIDNTANDKGTSDTYAYSGFDNNPDGGGFDINNLGNGSYKMTEYRAPTGYGPETDDKGNTKSYAFTVNNGQAQWTDNDNKIDITIGNKALPGVAWDKVDADTNKLVKDSQWTVTKLDSDGKPITSTAKTVVDCVDSGTVTCANAVNTSTAYADRDGTAGGFRIWPDESGNYQLVETIPAGYWHPQGEVVYRFHFTITDGNPDSITQIYQSDDSTAVAGNNIMNTQPQVAWSKVAADAHDDLLAGSEWTIRGPLTKNAQNGSLSDISGKIVTAHVTDCVRSNQASDLCSDHSNTLTGNAPEYADIDPTSGKFKVLGLPMPENDTDTYYYELTETQAPEGYALTGITYTFAIGRKQPAVAVPITASGDATSNLQVQGNTNSATQNLIPNVKMVSALPLTGGPGNWAARDWMLIGGGIAVVAIAALALTNEWLKRKAVIV